MFTIIFCFIKTIYTSFTKIFCVNTAVKHSRALTVVYVMLPVNIAVRLRFKKIRKQ